MPRRERVVEGTRTRRPTIEEVHAAAQKGIILDWSDNPALYEYGVAAPTGDGIGREESTAEPGRRRRDRAVS